jgi:hypothetical protein
VSHFFPGITPLNVYDLTLDWWRIYVDHARAMLEAKKTASSTPRPSRPRR